MKIRPKGQVEDLGDYGLVVVLAALMIAVVMLFAQVKLFSIDSTLKEILAELRATRGLSRYDEDSDEKRPASSPLGL